MLQLSRAVGRCARLPDLLLGVAHASAEIVTDIFCRLGAVNTLEQLQALLDQLGSPPTLTPVPGACRPAVPGDSPASRYYTGTECDPEEPQLWKQEAGQDPVSQRILAVAPLSLQRY